MSALIRAATVGFARVVLLWWERVIAVSAAVLLVAYFPWSDEIGYILTLLLCVNHWRRARRMQPA